MVLIIITIKFCNIPIAPVAMREILDNWNNKKVNNTQ